MIFSVACAALIVSKQKQTHVERKGQNVQQEAFDLALSALFARVSITLHFYIFDVFYYLLMPKYI